LAAFLICFVHGHAIGAPDHHRPLPTRPLAAGDRPEFRAAVEDGGSGASSAELSGRFGSGLKEFGSKRRNLPYRNGRSRAWLKIKNPDSAAMTGVWEDRFNRSTDVENRTLGPALPPKEVTT
jgi:hypothetical protein